MDRGSHGRCASPGMNFKINPSLVSRAAISVTAALWYHEDVLKPNKIYRLDRDYTDLEDRVANKAQSLLIPENLKENILVSIRHVKNQLRHWIEIHGAGMLKDVDLYNDFSWTSIGLIDFTQTANNIIKRGCLTPIKAFKLACFSCSVEQIYELWPLARKYFYKSIPYSGLMGLWVKHLQRTFPLSKIYQELPSEFFSKVYNSACRDDNMSAFRLFEQQSLEERKYFIDTALRFAKSLFFRKNPHALLFFLSYMDATIQDEILKKNPVRSLIFFLKWPLRLFFLQLADKLWECCTEDGFCQVIKVLTEKIRLRKNEAAIYKNLFREFWKKSPLELRNHYIKKEFSSIFRRVLYHLPIDNDLNILYSGAYNERILTTFLDDANASLYFITEEDKAGAIRALFQNFLSSI